MTNPKILTEEELKRAEETMEFAKLSFSFGADVDITPEFTDSILNIIASHRSLLSANAELSFKNMKLKELLNRLDSYMDFSVPWVRKQELSFTDPSGINQVFKEVYRVINPEQAAINEALEELK